MKKTFAKVFGVILLLVGVLGFFANPIVGDTGFFHADMIHNIVHLVLGLLLLLMSGTDSKAGMGLKLVGFVYLLVALLGFFMMPAGMEMGGSFKLLGLVGVNGSDNWLHLVLGVVVLLAGFAGGKGAAMPMGGAPTQQM